MQVDNPTLEEMNRQKLAMLGLSEEFLNGAVDTSSYAAQMAVSNARFVEFARVKQKQILDSLKRVAIVSSHRRGVNVHTIYPHKKVTKFRSRRTAKVWVKEFRASIK